MRKILLLIILFYLLSLLKPLDVNAQCVVEPSTIEKENLCQDFKSDKYNQFKLKVAKSLLSTYPDALSNITVDVNNCGLLGFSTDATIDPDNVIFTFPTDKKCRFLFTGERGNTPDIFVKYNPPGVSGWTNICSTSINVVPAPASCNASVYWESGGIGDVQSKWHLRIDNIVPPTSAICTEDRSVLSYPDPPDGKATKTSTFNLKGVYDTYIGQFYAGNYTISVASREGQPMCTVNFNVAPQGSTPLPPTPTLTLAPPTPTYDPTQPSWTPVPPIPSLAPICDQLPTENNFSANCWNCINTGGIWTAIGCLPTDLEALISEKIFPVGTGIAGGIAFLYFLYGVFLILTSGGNAEKIAEGKEIIISALSGLFLIIFSVFLLRVIGYDILKIPGFS